MGQPHKHAEVFKAWADGADIEFRYSDRDAWEPVSRPAWSDQMQWRIKPEKKTYRVALFSSNDNTLFWTTTADGEQKEAQYHDAHGFVRWLGPRQEYEVGQG